MGRIPFKTWAPDLPGLAGTNTLNVASGVYPYDQGYKPIQALSSIASGALDAQCLGAACFTDATGNNERGTNYIFAGTQDKLYRASAAVSSVSFSDISGTSYTAGSTDSGWEFAQYQETILASNASDGLQSATINSGSFSAASLSGDFSKPRHLAVIRDFVILANTNNGNRIVGWSEFAQPTAFSVGVNQSDTQQLPSDGPINKVTGGEFGLIWQERAITRMTYVGPPLIFRFDKISHEIGLAAPGAIARFGAMYFFWSNAGFYITDGSSEPQPVGHEKVDEWFRGQINTKAVPFFQWSAATDPIRKLIFLAFAASSSSTPDTLLIFNYATGEFSTASINSERLLTVLLHGAAGTGAPFLAAFDTSHNLASFTGSTLAATLTTSDFEPDPGNRAMVTSLFPLTDTSSATGVLQYRERPASAYSNSSSASMQSNGEIPVQQSGAFFRAQISIPSSTSWTYINGIDYDAQPDGEL